MMLQSFSRILGSDERGSVIPLATVVIVALLALAGLAIDVGQLYQAQVQFQKAVDAGALAGIGASLVLADVPTSVEGLKEFIETRGREITCENLRRFGYACGPSVIVDPSYSTENRTLTMTVEAEVPLLLINLVPFYHLGSSNTADTYLLTAVAAVERKTANVSLVLDVSDSMQCPTHGSCACLSPNRTQDCQREAAALGTDQKIERLRVAVDKFVQRFDERRDRVSMVLYNIAADVAVPFRSGGELGFTRTAFSQLGSVAPKSNTNICDGLLRAYSEFNDKALLDESDAAYVLFSDGAPTAGRFLFANAKAGMEANNPFGVGAYDYTHYTVQWVTEGNTYAGPSLLVKTGAITRNYASPYPPLPHIAGVNVPSCSAFQSAPPSDHAAYNQVFSGCLNSMGLHAPRSPGRVFANQINASGSKQYKESWREQYFNCAVQFGDFLREKNGRVYSVGLGPNSNIAEAISMRDPFQRLDENWARKDILLSRIANDYLESVPLAQQRYGSAYPEFTYPGYRSFAENVQAPAAKVGRYYPSPSAEQLEQVFDAIAQKILLRLIK